jgi:hypothetical protein
MRLHVVGMDKPRQLNEKLKLRRGPRKFILTSL